MHDYDIHKTLFLDWEIHDPCARGSEFLSRVNMHTEWKCIEFYNIFFFTFTVVGDWYYVHSVLFSVPKLWNSLPMGQDLGFLGGIWPFSERICFGSQDSTLQVNKNTEIWICKAVSKVKRKEQSLVLLLLFLYWRRAQNIRIWYEGIQPCF